MKASPPSSSPGIADRSRWLRRALAYVSILLFVAGIGAARGSAQTTALPPDWGADEAYAVGRGALRQLPGGECDLGPREALAAPGWSADAPAHFRDDRAGCHWLRARLAVPEGPTAWSQRAWLFEGGYHGRATLWVYRGDSLAQRAEMGNDLPLDARAYPHVWSQAYLNVAPLRLDAGATYTLLYRYANPEGQSLYGTFDDLAFTLLPAGRVDRGARLHLLLSGLMVGGLLLLCLYQFAQWTVYRTTLDATYCLMLVGLMSYVMYDDFLLHGLFAGRRVGELWLYVTGSLGLMGFFRFAQLTLRTVDYDPRRDRTLGALVIVKAVEIGVYVVVVAAAGAGASWLEPVAARVPEGFRVTLIATLLLFSYSVTSHFRENADRATRAFLYGNLSLVLGVLIVTTRVYLLPLKHVAPVRWYLRAIEWPFEYIIELGILGMALFFAFAVAMLTKEREIGIEREYTRKLAAVEMKALRSQMNPHFLFNGLNSIKSFVISNRPREAADYLSKFARLIRLILENSKDALVPLDREIETLRLYMAMEALRFQERFTYEIAVDPSVDPHLYEVPPTLIQPYVENAIWHGLLHLKRPGGHLRIAFRSDGGAEQLTVVIEDNGVGRAEAQRLRSLSATRRKSMGMRITAERIAILDQLYGIGATVVVSDLRDAGGAPLGTRVTVRLSPRDSRAARDLDPARDGHGGGGGDGGGGDDDDDDVGLPHPTRRPSPPRSGEQTRKHEPAT